MLLKSAVPPVMLVVHKHTQKTALLRSGPTIVCVCMWIYTHTHTHTHAHSRIHKYLYMIRMATILKTLFITILNHIEHTCHRVYVWIYTWYIHAYTHAHTGRPGMLHKSAPGNACRTQTNTHTHTHNAALLRSGPAIVYVCIWIYIHAYTHTHIYIHNMYGGHVEQTLHHVTERYRANTHHIYTYIYTHTL